MSDGVINEIDNIGRLLIYKKWRTKVGITPNTYVEILKKGDVLYIIPCEKPDKDTPGVVKKVDELGRIVIPKKIRKELGIESGIPLEICKEDGLITVQVKSYGCCICGTKPNRSEVFLTLNGKIICKVCSQEIAELKYVKDIENAHAI